MIDSFLRKNTNVSNLNLIMYQQHHFSYEFGFPRLLFSSIGCTYDPIHSSPCALPATFQTTRSASCHTSSAAPIVLKIVYESLLSNSPRRRLEVRHERTKTTNLKEFSCFVTPSKTLWSTIPPIAGLFLRVRGVRQLIRTKYPSIPSNAPEKTTHSYPGRNSKK